MVLLIHAGALLDTCPKFVHQSSNSSSSAINEAAAADHAKAVELLLDYGADNNPLVLGTGAPYYRYLRQHTLHIAAEAGAEDNEGQLSPSQLNGGILKLPDGLSTLGLMWKFAIKRDHVAVADLFLTHGANPNHIDAHRCTATYFAAQKAASRYTLSLIRHGADLNKSDNRGRTPLILAAYHRNLDTLCVLLEHGVDPNATAGSTSYRPLHISAAKVDRAAVTALLEKGASKNLPDKEGRTALMIAADINPFSFQRGGGSLLALVKRGAYLDCTDSSGKTALMYACRELVGAGCNVNIRDQKGKTALDT
ncbi:ankyrin repeat domain-containing protein [Aspergillus stella-maris]|uniref:ankyrin repeat domain-containing protein n=1 Tax=Aspergillus stella-maris TaxID=1810926 RepID=UPI003CCD8782